MKRLWFLSAALLMAAPILADEGEKKPLKSGLQPGDLAGAFDVLDQTGPNKGKKLCYR